MAATCSAQGSTAHTSTPGTRARCAAYRLPIAPQPSTATRTGGVGSLMRPTTWRRELGADVRARRPPTPRPPTTRPSTTSGSPPGAGRNGAGCRAARSGGRLAVAGGDARRSAQPNRAAVAAVASATSTPPATAVVHAVLLHRVAAAVDDGDRDAQAPARRRRRCTRSHSVAGPGQLLLPRAPAGAARQCPGCPRRATTRSPKRAAQRACVVAVLADVGHAERVGDEQVLGVGRLAVGADHLRRDARSGRNGLTVAPDAAMPPITTPSASRTGIPPAPGNTACGEACTKPAEIGAGSVVMRFRCSVLGICCVAEIQALEAARAMPPGPPWSSRDAVTSAPLAPTTAIPPRRPSCSALSTARWTSARAWSRGMSRGVRTSWSGAAWSRTTEILPRAGPAGSRANAASISSKAYVVVDR